MNLLCNPMGKSLSFCLVDWLVERNNLYTKVIFAGTGPNCTINHIIKQSPLIEVYRNCHITVENTFHLTHCTIRHAQPDMTKTIQRLASCIKESTCIFSNLDGQPCAAFPIKKVSMVDEAETDDIEPEDLID
ncbi:uncharacterized protein F5891DRAFT_1125665 [Suillus fuscotomentosus]|uniref:DUF6589 domain-containing protein n=1 Tax=Suillus fuscotomentosus TaxID=1912939 RepID=A0AAD4EHV0_9AGAM|nr:uncharacterized protein F5891DRAFT_1125665 [Suillus fuscotomentosus]KAG1906351.1 hypothetical protein F5891DRAFT_1125665 [Suillus fuscotomentosus]